MEEERVINPADKLLPELWMEIFSKLPAKTLLKSRKRMLLPQIPFCPGGRADTVIGFDPVINDYKVVMIFFPFVLSELEGPASILVYELGTGCWRVNVGVEVPIMWYFGDKVLARGVMHWISFSLDERPLRTNYTHIVSFDFGSETFSYTELPGDRWDDKDKFTWPFLLGDQFAVLDVARASVCIWVMKKCGGSGMESWSKCYHTKDSDTYKFFLEHKAVKNLIYIESIHKFLFEVDGVVKSYDLESHKMKNLEVTDCRYVMDPYVESLLLCKGLNDQFSTKIMEYGGFG